MSAHIRAPLFVLFFGASTVFGATYHNAEHIAGAGFYNSFNFEAIADPTHGRVNYVDQNTAMSTNLTFSSDNTFVLRADHQSVVPAGSAGRNSVRIASKNAYTTHVAVFDIAHMPQGCGTWPAVWETNEVLWPAGGEVDILEGVNDQGTNQATLHTSPGCTMPASRPMTGTPGQLDCNTAVNGNTGCSVMFTPPTSYGPTFNANGGGWYAMERTNGFISVWFWSRNDPTVPADVRAGGSTVDTDNWGTPAGYWPSTSTCDLESHFAPNNIIINLTLCGDWAGAVYPASCPSTCIDYVDNNPAGFVDAYFQFNSINIYN
ncbi:putative glycosidase C21B10.07 [Mycena sanguinolenta]|uniref:Putative glycosidase C21B10.07 n=1 Tax=Mycena sanguinolenta TaxID=230812 RepID=A0A8H6YYC1_9AGAR|nr:putative glycosidase C21B10.07 [Mycena sanguinolenta]